MHIETDGLVIKEQNVGESDRLITVLTGQYGLIRAFVSGGKSIKNRNLAGTQLLAYSDFVFYKGKDSFNVNQATERQVFFELRSDIENLSLAFYLAELFGELAPESAQCDELLKLLLNSIYLLSKNKCDPKIIKSVAELRALSISGYMPSLVACRECGEFESEVFHFSIKNGDICCKSCMEFSKSVVDYSRRPISYSTVTAMRHIIYSEPKKVFDFKLSPNALAQLSAVTEAFTLYQTGRTYKTLDFYKSL